MTGGNDVVSVVVPTLNARRTISPCLSSVVGQSYPAKQLIVVDGGSTDGTREIASDFADVLISGDYKRTTARRIGVKASTGKFVVFLDSDQVMEPDLLRECVQLANKKNLGAIKVPEEDDASGVWAGCRRLDRMLTQTEELSYPRFYEREVYEQLGGHTASFENYLEDRDLYLRARATGVRIGWVNLRVTNLLGRVNPLELGIKGARAANDAAFYYQVNAAAGERIRSVVLPRIRQFLEGIRGRGLDGQTVLLFPIYTAVAYGPRLMTVSVSRHSARPP